MEGSFHPETATLAGSNEQEARPAHEDGPTFQHNTNY